MAKEIKDGINKQKELFDCDPLHAFYGLCVQ